MAELGTFATLHDWAARFGDDNEGRLFRDIVETQVQTNKILQVLPYHPCNSGLTEKVGVRTALPKIAWRLINRGVKPSKSASKQVDFTTGTMEALAQIDEELMELNGNDPSFRMSENKAFQIAMNNEMAATMFYGDEKTSPAKFTGLSAYYYSLNNTVVPAVYAEHTIDCGGTGNNLTSIWICCMGEQSMYGIFPAKTHAGFEYRDNGRVKSLDADGGELYKYESQYKWRNGLALKDPRFVVRMCNIDVSTLTADKATDFINKMITGYNRIEDPSMGTMAIFCNRDMETYFDKCAIMAPNVRLGLTDFGGKKITAFRGTPILRCDGILSTEEQVK